eukprot:TRINITY_DN10337_c0_g1_i1.p1 TRINITY_DN10337_c0_g1~~TRINITY_DN10337_c0_g1_i1.p1  ORF type:complete len:491 (+),score=82.95 TRINITY_DN10337_c0_g1_i1:366-1838(+)
MAISIRSEAIRTFLPPPSMPGGEGAGGSTRIAMVHARIEGFAAMRDEVNPLIMHQMNTTIQEVIDSSAREIRGVLVSRERESWLVVFHTPDAALRWALAVQMQLLYVKWPDELLEHPMAQVVRDDDDEIIFKGPRMQMSVAYENTVVSSDENDNVTLQGTGFERARKLCRAAHGGQILVSGNMWKAVQGRLQSFGTLRCVDLGMHRLVDEDSDELVVSITPDKMKNRKFPIPRTARPPTQLIRMHMEKLEALVANFEKTLQYNIRKQGANSKQGVTISLRINDMLPSFTRHQRLLLLKELKALIECCHQQEPMEQRYADSEKYEAEVTKRMNAMDEVLDNVSNQLKVLPILEKRIERLQREKADLYEALQRERADYLKELAECGEHMRSYAKNHTDVEFVLESLRVWSRRDQLRLNDVYAPTFKDPRDMPNRFSSLNLEDEDAAGSRATTQHSAHPSQASRKSSSQALNTGSGSHSHSHSRRSTPRSPRY